MFSTLSTSIFAGVPDGLFAAYFALVGTVVGSYLNVVAHRLPRGVSTATPRSRCPRCLMPIRPWHNVPVFGWVALGGRCRDCGVSISARYPATEAATGGLFLVAWLRFEPAWISIVVAGFCALFVVLAAIDVDHHQLPVVPMRVAIGIALALQPWLDWVPPFTAVLTAVGAAAGLAVLSAGWRRSRGVDGFGRGDLEMIALVGALLGPEGVVVAFVVASVVALAAVGVQRLRGRRADVSPFGACLAIGAIMVLLARGG